MKVDWIKGAPKKTGDYWLVRDGFSFPAIVEKGLGRGEYQYLPIGEEWAMNVRSVEWHAPLEFPGVPQTPKVKGTK
jgi:hypothetical protein